MFQENDRFFFEGFIITLILTFLPFKALAFAIPLIFLFWFIIRSKSGLIFKKVILLALFGGMILGVYTIAYFFNDHSFILSNGMLSFINYSSFFVLFLIPNNITSEKYNYEFYAKALLPVLLIEGLYGIGQRIVSFAKGIDHGDLVEGTINPLSAFQGSTSGFGNQFFSINLIFLLIFCFPYVVKVKKGILSYVIGFLAVVLASVGHAFYSLILSVIIVFVYYEGHTLLVNPKRLFVFLMVPLVMLFTLATLDENVYADASRQAEMFFTGETPKSKAIKIVFSELNEEYPNLHLMGLGPGQYSSRAGIIASGQYGPLSDFFCKIPFLNFGMTDAFRDNVLEYWLDYTQNSGYGNSTMNRPFLSLLSVYSEFGGVFFFLLLSVIFLHIKKAKKAYKMAKLKNDFPMMLISCGFSTIILFIITIGLYENYYEAPQGIFVGVLLIKITSSLIKKEFERQESYLNEVGTHSKTLVS